MATVHGDLQMSEWLKALEMVMVNMGGPTALVLAAFFIGLGAVRVNKIWAKSNKELAEMEIDKALLMDAAARNKALTHTPLKRKYEGYEGTNER